MEGVFLIETCVGLIQGLVSFRLLSGVSNVS